MDRELAAELAALRVEITALHQVLAALLPLLTAQVRSTASGAAQAPGAAPTAPPASPSATLLVSDKAQRLQAELQRRMAAGLNPDGDTEVDVLIDRLHDLVDPL